jgi:hypothetical protein
MSIAEKIAKLHSRGVYDLWESIDAMEYWGIDIKTAVELLIY